MSISSVVRSIRSLTLAFVGTTVVVSTATAPLVAQAGPPEDVILELRALDLQVHMIGSGADAVRAAPVEAAFRAPFDRLGLLEDLPTARPGDCCELRLDVRVTDGVVGVADRVPIQAYSMRLEVGMRDRMGRTDTWVVLWRSPATDDIVEARDLETQLAFASRQLADDFLDAYLAVFPIR